MENITCDVCVLEPYPEKLHMAHIFSKAHIANAKKTVNLDLSIHVSGYPFQTTMKDIYEHFSKHGRIKVVEMSNVPFRKRGPHFAFVEFTSAESLESVLKLGRHRLNGKMCYVNKRQKSAAREEPANLETLQKCKSVVEQLQTLHNMLKLTEEDYQTREKLRIMVETELKQYFPECKVFLFGSSVNGYGSKGCDVDLLAQTGTCFVKSEDDTDETNKPADVPTVNQVKNGDVAHEVLHKLTKNGQLNFIKKALNQNDEYTGVFYIPASNCPIVKFSSKTFSLRCDLSNGHTLPLYNTALLQIFGKLDARVAPLMAVLRRWAKINSYINPKLFSSYAFSLMVIFFMQTRSPPILPSVNYMRSKTKTETIIDGWDCSFCCEPSKLERSRNRQSLEILLLDFFTFYRDFDYYSHVISPLTGRCELKKKFDPELYPGAANFTGSRVCIQDPFETSRNCAANLNFNFMLSMVDHLKRVVEDFRSKPEPVVPTEKTDAESISKTWGVTQLLGSRTRYNNPKRERRTNSYHFNVIMTHKMFNNLKKEFNAVDESQNAFLGQVWIYDMTNMVLDVLRQVMLLECDIIDAVSNNWCPRKRKLDDVDDTTPSKVLRTTGMHGASVNGNRNPPGRHQTASRRAPDIRNMAHFVDFLAHAKNESDEPFLTAQVIAYQNTWGNRTQPTAELISTGLDNVLENQRNVSLQLVDNVKVKKYNDSKFIFEFLKGYNAGYTSLLVKVSPFGRDTHDLRLPKFVCSFMQKIIESL